MAKRKKIKSDDREVVDIMEIFEWSYQQSVSDLSRLEEFQRMYDNVVNDNAWPTTSKMPIPLLFTMVEKSLPQVMSYLFPKNRFIQLVPTERGASMDNVLKSESALQHAVKYRMALQHNALPTLKDCFKLSLGYGIVEPTLVSMPVSKINEIRRNGKTVAKGRTMDVSNKPRMSQRYRYLTPGQCIVTPDGTDFNGHNRVSWSFFLDIYKEAEFRDMYSRQPTDGERAGPLMGNVEQIIEEAKTLGFDTTVPIVNLVGELAGIDLRKATSAIKHLPTCIPVLKCYNNHRHVWIANGTQRIFDEDNKFQTLRCPLVKASAWPEGHRWYPMSTVEAAQKMALGMNVWMNALFDIMTYIVKPVMLYSSTAFGGKAPERGPNSEIGVMSGDVRAAAQYMQQPTLPESVMAVGDTLQRWYGSAVGQESFMQEGSAGLLRGGTFAFESLVGNSRAREILGGAVLETGFMQSVVNQALILLQLQAQDESQLLISREYDPKSRKEYVREMEVTEDDLVHAYEVRLKMKHRGSNEAVDRQGRLSEFNAFKDDPYIDQYELRARTLFDEDDVERLVLPKEVVTAKQAEREQLDLQAMRQNAVTGQQGAPAVPQVTTEEQALAGAARLGGA